MTQRLGLSYAAGVVLVGTVPPLLGFFLLNYLMGAYDPSNPIQFLNIVSLLSIIPIPLVCLLGARYVAQRTSELGEYAKTLGSGEGLEGRLKRTAAVRPLAAVWAVLAAFIFVILVSAPSPGPSPSIDAVTVALFITPMVLTVLPLATLVWVFGYSMYTIYVLGGQEMTLGFFGRDRTLGLRPFGLTVFHLTLVYLGASVVLVVSLNIPPQPIEGNLALLSFFILAIPLFLLPLRTLRKQLIRAKARELDWIGRRYESIYSALRPAEGGPLADVLKSDLATIRQLRDDIQQVHNWPFDTGILARLVAVIISVSAILLSGYLRDVLKF